MDWTPVQGEFLPLSGGLLGWAGKFAFFFTWFDTGDQLATLVYNV